MRSEDDDTRVTNLRELRRAIMRSGRPAADRFLLIRILDLEAVRGEAIVSVAQLADDVGVTAKAASRSLNRLERDECFHIVRRSRQDVGRRIRPQAFGFDPFPVVDGSPLYGTGRSPLSWGRPPDGGDPPRRAGGRIPGGGESRLRTDGGESDGGEFSEPVVAPDLSLVDPPLRVPPSLDSLREEERVESGLAKRVEVTDFASARRRTRQAVGLAWLERRAQPITADDVNERRVAVWIWQAAGEDPGAFEQLLVDLVELWIADAYILQVRRPWAHLQAQLGVLRGQVSKGGHAVALERRLEQLEGELTDAVSFGRGYDVEQRIEAQLETVRAELRGVAS